MRLPILIAAVVLSLCCLASPAQDRPITDPDAPSLLSDVPSVPGISARLRGLNGGITLTGVHDSSSGWYTLLTPAVAYSFNQRFSADISMPVYLYRLAATQATQQQTGPGGGPYGPPQRVNTSNLVARTWDPGDVVLAAHANFTSGRFADTFTPSLTVPTGNAYYGLSTGRVTFDFDNHLQAYVGRGALVLGFGGGDSSNLVNRLVTKDYTSLGPLAHFQLGLMVPLDLPGLRRVSFQSVAYEQLPLGDSKIYTTLRRPGYPSLTVVSGRSVSEDNGFTNSLTMPLDAHFTMQAYYNRSLRLHLDTAAIGITWVARPSRYARRPRQSLIDDLIRP